MGQDRLVEQPLPRKDKNMTDDQTGTPPQGHPAWQELLDILPDSLHSLVTPKLAEWDKKQQDQVQGLHQQYDPYKEFISNEIDPEVLKQSLFIANSLQSDPEAFVKRVVENYNLEVFNQQQAEAQEEEEEEMTWDGEDISKHPQFEAMRQQLEQINSTLTAEQQAKQQREQEAREQKEFDDYLEGLKEKYKDRGEFNDLFVSSVMANGLDGDAAVELYYTTVNEAVAKATGQQTQTPLTPPPVVMGGSGNAGSGSPDQAVRMGDLSKGATEDLVIQMLKQSQGTT